MPLPGTVTSLVALGVIKVIALIILALVSVLAIKAIYRGIEAKKKLNKDYNYKNKKNIDKKE